MTPEQLVQAFADRGLDTPEKVGRALSYLLASTEVDFAEAELEKAIENRTAVLDAATTTIDEKQQEAVAAQEALKTRREELAAVLKKNRLN